MDTTLRELCQSQKQYPLLSHVAEICFSAPVSNAWPERGVSAVKRIKTRYFIFVTYNQFFGWLVFSVKEITTLTLCLSLIFVDSGACSKMTC